jgi:hypothetical protein
MSAPANLGELMQVTADALERADDTVAASALRGVPELKLYAVEIEATYYGGDPAGPLRTWQWLGRHGRPTANFANAKPFVVIGQARGWVTRLRNSGGHARLVQLSVFAKVVLDEQLHLAKVERIAAARAKRKAPPPIGGRR